MADTRLSYHLAQTYLEVTGTKTTTTDVSDTEKQTSTSSASIQLGVEADPDNYFVLNLARSGLTKSEFTIGITEDGRLTSASGTSTGQAGAILKGAATLLGTVAGTAFNTPGPVSFGASVFGAHLAGFAGGPPPLEIESERPPYAKDHGDMYDRLVAARETAGKLVDRIRAYGDDLANAEQLPPGEEGSKQLALLTATLQAVRSEIAIIEQHMAAWTIATVNKTSEVFSYRMPLLRVPALADVPTGPIPLTTTKTPADTDWMLDAAEMFEHLNLVVVKDVARPHGDAVGGDHRVGAELESIVYRRPHYADIILFRFDPGSASFVEEQRSRQLVVSEASHTSEISFEKSWFGEKKVALEFSNLGTVTSVSTEDGSSAAEALGALSAIPPNMAEGLTAGGSISSALNAIETKRITETLALIELEAKEKAATAKAQPASPNAKLHAEIAELELRKRQLTLQLQIGRLEPRVTSLESG